MQKPKERIRRAVSCWPVASERKRKKTVLAESDGEQPVGTIDRFGNPVAAGHRVGGRIAGSWRQAQAGGALRQRRRAIEVAITAVRIVVAGLRSRRAAVRRRGLVRMRVVAEMAHAGRVFVRAVARRRSPGELKRQREDEKDQKEAAHGKSLSGPGCTKHRAGLPFSGHARARVGPARWLCRNGSPP